MCIFTDKILEWQVSSAENDSGISVLKSDITTLLANTYQIIYLSIKSIIFLLNSLFDILSVDIDKASGILFF